MEEPPTTAAPPMRTGEEIQWAHDVLSGITENQEALAAMPDIVQVGALVARSALCWALGHEVGDEGFALILRTIVSYSKRCRELLEQVERQLEREEAD
jgi:hypothetical protein